jgi:hypothetical protein
MKHVLCGTAIAAIVMFGFNWFSIVVIVVMWSAILHNKRPNRRSH